MGVVAKKREGDEREAGNLFCAPVSASDSDLEFQPRGTLHDYVFELSALVACQSLQLATCEVTAIESEPLSDDITHYTIDLQVGSGEYDAIRIHRVIADGVPGPKRRALFMIHGDLWPFGRAFLGGATSPHIAVADSMPFYLAERGIDVWGVDWRWHGIPGGLTDYSFMRDWNLDLVVGDGRLAIRIARLARTFMGDGFEQVYALGWSRGSWPLWALANAEAPRPFWQRDIAGIIPVDGVYKVGPQFESQRQLFCDNLAQIEAMIEGGTYQVPHDFLIQVGDMAVQDPEGASPLVPDWTNYQVALDLASRTFNWTTPIVPHYHFAKGIFDEAGATTDLTYTPPDFWIEQLQQVAPVEAAPFMADTSRISCDETDVVYDDYLANITVPVFYVGAAGGFGETGAHTSTLVGSDDVSTLIVEVEAPGENMIDFGHSDLFQAAAARELFWEPVADWIWARAP